MNNRNPHIHTLSAVTILFCFLFADILNAQDRPYHDHRDHRDRQSQRDMDDQRDEPVLGLRVGANYANVWDESDQEFEADGVFGPAGGVFLSMPLGPYIGLQPEILFSQKGYTRDGEFLGEEYNFSRRASYIDIPFQLQIGRASCRERVYNGGVVQAEDGIRDGHVTGVQTCALPICLKRTASSGLQVEFFSPCHWAPI